MTSYGQIGNNPSTGEAAAAAAAAAATTSAAAAAAATTSAVLLMEVISWQPSLSQCSTRARAREKYANQPRECAHGGSSDTWGLIRLAGVLEVNAKRGPNLGGYG